jgi:hypothetical protein
MNQQMLSLEAAQASFAKVSQLNLFNYIKWLKSQEVYKEASLIT